MDTADRGRPRRGTPPAQPAEVYASPRRPASDLGGLAVRLAGPDDIEPARALLLPAAVEGHFAVTELDEGLASLAAPVEDERERTTLLWVAAMPARIVGAIGLQRRERFVTAVRWLRVDDAYRRRGVGRRLLEEALLHCQREGYLKVVLELELDRKPVVDLFRSLGFTLHRERERDGRRALEFFLDLYRDPHL